MIEVAVVITDGKQVLQEYTSLVNPNRKIPSFIEGLTGINGAMVAGAPLFEDIAQELFELLEGKLFVAHNVAFDYNFLRHHFRMSGYELKQEKLCTVRYARKVMPDLPGYSLGKLCHSIGIPVSGRHRALGDAAATALLLHRLLDEDAEGHHFEHLLKKSAKSNLPPNLSQDTFEALPTTPGVYYFMDAHKQVLYVGKARNIRKRINSHFGKDLQQKNMKLLFEEIHDVDYQLTGSELIAYLLESAEIKRLQPSFNKAQRRRDKGLSLFLYTDRGGYSRLTLRKPANGGVALAHFATMSEGRRFLYQFSREHKLCEKMTSLQTGKGPCLDYATGRCEGACMGEEPPQSHNARMAAALEALEEAQHNLLIIGQGRNYHERSLVCFENGRLVGYGYVHEEIGISHPDQAMDYITPVDHDADLQRIIRMYLVNPAKEDKVIRY